MNLRLLSAGAFYPAYSPPPFAFALSPLTLLDDHHAIHGPELVHEATFTERIILPLTVCHNAIFISPRRQGEGYFQCPTFIPSQWMRTRIPLVKTSS